MRSRSIGFMMSVASTASIAQTPPTTPPINTYATIIQKPGCNTIVFGDNPSPAAAVNVGQSLQVEAGLDTCSGIIDRIDQHFVLRHYPTVDVRSYVTTIILR